MLGSSGIGLRPKSFMHNIAPQVDLQSAARQIMEEHGFQPDFPPQVNQQLSEILKNSAAGDPGPGLKDQGFRDLRSLLYPATKTRSQAEERRLSAKVSRQLRLLRAHGLIRKLSKSHSPRMAIL